MSYHFSPNEYNHLIGQTLGGKLEIINIEHSPDNIYMTTDGHMGNPHLLTLSNGDTFKFRHFTEVINKYGDILDKKVGDKDI
jgi:hypothetical protein